MVATVSICPIPEKLTGPRASPLDHSWITHSRHRTALGGHQRTPAWSISYSRGRLGSLSDTGGHASDTVRDREAPGSNPGPPTNFEFKIADFARRRKSVGRREVTAVSQIFLELGRGRPRSSGLRTVD